MTEIGMELYNWRCNNNLSQREAAHSLGVSQAQICAYEKGKQLPRADVRARLLEKIRPAEPEQPVQEDKPEEVLPFPIRLARSRGISDEYMQRTLDMVRNRERDEDATQDAQGGAKPALPPASGAGADKLLIGRVIGLLEGLSVAYGIDLSKHISMLEAAGGEA